MMCYNITMTGESTPQPRNRKYSKRGEGKLPSSEDIDWVVVHRAIREGYDGKTTIGERREIVRAAHSLGWSDNEIERLTRTMTARAAIRLRNKLGLLANPQRNFGTQEKRMTNF